MTDKQLRIISAALTLFAKQGYNAVSTARIARDAEVSEGLIFRHFTNKKGLLDAIMIQTQEKLETLFSPLFFESNPKARIRQFIEITFTLPESEYGFWRLLFKLKWEEEFSYPDKMEPVIAQLTLAFEALGNPQARSEAECLAHIIESIASYALREGIERQMHLKDFLIEKYQV